MGLDDRRSVRYIQREPQAIVIGVDIFVTDIDVRRIQADVTVPGDDIIIATGHARRYCR